MAIYLGYHRIGDKILRSSFEPQPKQHWVEITKGMSGWFAVDMWLNPGGDGAPDSFPEPYNTGICRYADPLQAAEEAVMWADDMDVPCALDKAIWEKLRAKGLIK